MTFSLHLDRAFSTKNHAEPGLVRDKDSVFYRAGRRAGLRNERPNPYAMDMPLYAKGYTAGLFRRSLQEAATFFGMFMVVVTLLGAYVCY